MMQGLKQIVMYDYIQIAIRQIDLYCIKITKIDRIFKSECTICQKVKKCNKMLFKLKLV